MAYYKYANKLTLSTDSAFDQVHAPGTRVPYSGIYRCRVCGWEASSTTADHLPPQGHHVHPAGMGAIQWQLVAASVHKPQ